VYPWSLPVVAETFDGGLNDVNGSTSIRRTRSTRWMSRPAGRWPRATSAAARACDVSGSRAAPERRRACSAPRRADTRLACWSSATPGSRSQLRIAGVPVGQLVTGMPSPVGYVFPADPERDVGSIIIVVATNGAAGLRAARSTLQARHTGPRPRRWHLGRRIGDIFVSFSTANPLADDIGIRAPGGAREPASQVAHIDMLHNDAMDPVFLATIQATEEAIVNALVGAETMTGRNGRTVQALPHDQLESADAAEVRADALVRAPARSFATRWRSLGLRDECAGQQKAQCSSRKSSASSESPMTREELEA